MKPALRSLAWLLALALLALPVVAVVEGWMGGEHWPLRTLRVQGELARVDRAQLQAAVLPHAQRGFFAVDLRAIQRTVDALPWVERAQVRKHWPDVLEVRIVEHRPFARWGEKQLLSEHGRLFPVGKLQAPAGLPLLDGPEGRVPEVVALYNQAHAQLANAGGVLGVALDRRGSWSISLRDGTRVVLGRSDPGARLARFAPMLPQLAAQNPHRRLVRADLRYTNGFALTWAKAVPTPTNHGSNT
ncbi:cell division protein FtsQ/DivIB [Thermomonas fusca]|uniref:cell division protein FtsQ/DivIB n=1 Tax=Thermomonas fusca TaxID=215690 RepID=UPI00041C6F36|nr:cell division protein FtsQ/DivIB [Thermomonas fusca]